MSDFMVQDYSGAESEDIYMKIERHLPSFSGGARKILLACALLSWGSALQAQTQELIESYIEAWIDFYPSTAFSQGKKTAAQQFEDFSGVRVSAWLELNHSAEKKLSALPAGTSLDDRVDAQVLLRQVRMELDVWQQDQVLTLAPQWYTQQISNALIHVIVSDKLQPPDQYRAVLNRLLGIRSLCDTGIENLKNGNLEKSRDAVKALEQTIDYYENDLLASSDPWTSEADRELLASEVRETTRHLHALAEHIQEKILPLASIPNMFGPELYTRKLALFSDNSLTPGTLPGLALKEIDRVRELMLELAQAWWIEQHGEQAKPEGQALLDAALAAMEEDRESNRQDFLKVFQDETKKSIDFVIEHELATVPQNRTVIIDLLPQHSPLATVGEVFPPGPFDPQAGTLLYLPSIPDDAPAETREGFYRSFNNHFNRMIISHEIFPGHDMQFKVGLEHSSKVRSLFYNPILAEGWASFSEVLMLDAGWGNGNKLTRLAHLRKRLENATRAYISVMVHAEGWTEERVIEFATTRGLLPAQFAINLWNRASDLDMALQLTSYFAGYHGIEQLYQEERQRLGDQFVQKNFVDSLLRAGSVPMAVLGEIVRQ